MKGMLPALVSLLALVFVFLVTATRALAQGNPPPADRTESRRRQPPVTPQFFLRNYCGPAKASLRAFDNDLRRVTSRKHLP